MAERSGLLLERDPGCLWRRSLDGVLLLPTGQPDPIRVAGSGLTVWLLLEEPATVDQIASDVAEIFGMIPDEVRADVASMLDELLSLSAVRIASTESAGPEVN